MKNENSQQRLEFLKAIGRVKQKINSSGESALLWAEISYITLK